MHEQEWMQEEGEKNLKSAMVAKLIADEHLSLLEMQEAFAIQPPLLRKQRKITESVNWLYLVLLPTGLLLDIDNYVGFKRQVVLFTEQILGIHGYHLKEPMFDVVQPLTLEQRLCEDLIRIFDTGFVLTRENKDALRANVEKRKAHYKSLQTVLDVSTEGRHFLS